MLLFLNFRFEPKTMSACNVPKAEITLCISRAPPLPPSVMSQDDSPLCTIAHLLQLVDFFLAGRPGGGTHLETEVWEEPPPASWGKTGENVRPRNFAGTPSCQLSINREPIGHRQLNPMKPSVRRRSSFTPLFQFPG